MVNLKKIAQQTLEHSETFQTHFAARFTLDPEKFSKAFHKRQKMDCLNNFILSNEQDHSANKSRRNVPTYFGQSSN